MSCFLFSLLPPSSHPLKIINQTKNAIRLQNKTKQNKRKWKRHTHIFRWTNKISWIPFVLGNSFWAWALSWVWLINPVILLWGKLIFSFPIGSNCKQLFGLMWDFGFTSKYYNCVWFEPVEVCACRYSFKF